MQLLRPGSVLDIGGNTGQYSRIAASVGRRASSPGTPTLPLFGPQLERSQDRRPADIAAGR